ncbi:hypothetical protein BVX98_03315, partial [bacterium F11]
KHVKIPQYPQNMPPTSVKKHRGKKSWELRQGIIQEACRDKSIVINKGFKEAKGGKLDLLNKNRHIGNDQQIIDDGKIFCADVVSKRKHLGIG